MSRVPDAFDPATPINLADCTAFSLGAAEVRPSTRELIWPSGQAVLEPRVMQVLVALARAQGEVVSRDALIGACWEGRAVSEDAINRALSQTRRAGREAQNAFEVETIARVGYRLKANAPLDVALAAPTPTSATAPENSGRRLVLAGAAATVTATLAGAGLWAAHTQRNATPSAEAVELVRKAKDANAVALSGDYAQAVAYLEEAVRIAPTYADAWGALSISYAGLRFSIPPEQQAALRAKQREATERALALDPKNADGWAGRVLATARFGNWLETERVCQAALRANPNASGVIFQYGRTLLEVGRLREAIPKFEHSFALGRRMARSQGLYGETLWCVGQTERALEVLNEANTQWPRHTAIWFPLLFIHAYRGDVRATSAMIDNVATRPVGVPQEEFDAWRLVARAASSKGKGDIERAFDVHRRFATRGVGLAGNTVGVLATFGALDQAFALAEAVYGLSDKKLPERAYSETQLGFLTMEQRMTRYLFRPDTAPLHADRRFARLCANIGLEAYWAETKTQPDFRVAQRG